ncbi:MAG TPA: thioredoxin-dependent thiol peroxidase [Bacteroidales bacterium]|nr:thioredoxin-dependent thiol peroxidase [Bacteroidales bacterium]HPT04347.1 thioredoxin-dependent thiol peroxidase [Bacteroidales bacterium]
MATLKIGDKAPEINAKDQNGILISLKDFIGKKVIVYFYPKDDTPGCTAEACNLRDNYEQLISTGFKIIGISADDEKKHQKFSDKYHLPFPLIPDTEKKIINAYGVWGPKKFMGRTFDGINRTTFVVSEDGKIEKIFSKVDTKNHTQQILEEYK